jgi:hypothetical protein
MYEKGSNANFWDLWEFLGAVRGGVFGGASDVGGGVKISMLTQENFPSPVSLLKSPALP